MAAATTLAHRLAMRVAVVLCVVASFGPCLATAEPGAKTHQDFRAEAEAAYQRKDYAAAKEAIKAALALRPDSPRYLHALAGFSALTGDAKATVDYLHRLAELGVATNVERDPDFAALQGTPEFLRVTRELSANRAPRGEADVVAELPGRTGIIEGIAFRDRTGDVFFGDVHQRCIWRRDRDGRIARWTAEDEELLGIFGIAVDEARNTLWATMTALPEMSEFAPDMKGQTALASFNLATSELRRVIDVPGDGRDHGLGDLTVAPDGTVYATDSKAPIIWKLAPDAEEMEKVIESPAFGSLQGIAIEKQTLLVADYANGLFQLDLPTGKLTPLAPPKNTTLLGIDGLVRVPGGLIGTQNGVEPQRIVRVGLSPGLDAVTGVTVLAAGLPNLTDLSLVALINARPTFVANSGWEGFDPAKAKRPAAHTVRVFQVALP